VDAATHEGLLWRALGRKSRVFGWGKSVKSCTFLWIFHAINPLKWLLVSLCFWMDCSYTTTLELHWVNTMIHLNMTLLAVNKQPPSLDLYLGYPSS
jgi:hypothetical protein